MTTASKTQYKMLILIKRRPGTSLEEFRDHYEQRHSKFAVEVAAAVGMSRYTRRYLQPISGGEFDYDVLTECWFDDRAKFEMVVASMAKGQLSPEIVADEQRFMDRTKTRFFTVVECDSDL
jgi:hypothetical protein